jgi:hypothetical protein
MAQTGTKKKKKRKVVTGCCFVTRKCASSYGSPHHQHPPTTELGSSREFSPDLAPSNFHLFGPLKNALRCHRFADDDEVKEVVHDLLHNQSQNFFQMVLRSLQTAGLNVLRSKDYIEKQYICNISNMNKDFFENKVQKLFEVPSYLYLLIVTCPL